MSLLGNLFSAPDPTRDWKADPGIRLVCDLSNHTLAGISLGQPVEALRGLGPPEIPDAARRGMYCYPSRGFEIDASQGKVDAFVIDWDVPAEGPYRPFGGTFVYRGRGLSLGPHTREEDFVRMFGAPYFRAPEAQEVVLFHEFDNQIEWQAEFAPNGHLKGMLIVTPPLLSEPDQRESYGVACPWPPPRAGQAPGPQTEGNS